MERVQGSWASTSVGAGSREHGASHDLPVLVTVIVPARNEERFIVRCLCSILEQTERRIQVVVVVGPSSDRTLEFVSELAAADPRLEVLRNPEAHIPKSLNIGLRAARGRWLVRVDGHSTIPLDYVERVVAHLENGRWGGVGGRKDAVPETTAGRAVAAAMGSRFGVGNSVYHHGTSRQLVDHIPYGAYPTALARELGGWDERLTVNEDFEFDQRVRGAGYELLYDPTLRISWRCTQSVPALFRQYRRYGRGKMAVIRLHPGSVRARHLAAPALTASWAFALLLARRFPRAGGALVLPYVCALTAASVRAGRRVDGARAKAMLPVAFVAMHAGWGLGFWEGIARLRDVGPFRETPTQSGPPGKARRSGRHEGRVP